MALELLAAIIAAVGMAGIAIAIRKLTRNRLPKWIVPVAAGLGMIGFAVLSEYGWYGRSAASLPEGVTVLHAETGRSPMRPWTFFAPITLKFSALDGRAASVHPANENLRMARVFHFERWAPTRDSMLIVDCSEGRQVAVTAGVEIDTSGNLTGAEWQPGEAEVLGPVCMKG